MTPTPPVGPIDDRQAQFLIAVADLCSVASLARLRVEVETADGARIAGIPGSMRPTGSEEEVDDGAYARTFRVSSGLVTLDEIVVCSIRAPSASAATTWRGCEPARPDAVTRSRRHRGR